MNRLLTPSEVAEWLLNSLQATAREQSAANGTLYEDELRYGVEVLSSMLFEGPYNMPIPPKPPT